ncbi:flavin reductase [Streptomyces sp. NBC_00525]|uniref:flavin reductase n=1 Tax=Streptomyces sp. NBC_00525 TaxID=2903660 RepID=UPI002E80DA3C|nr:flavin reductase [Streptomyces sp. NBC_00525]WUC97139.1 flavin reductase [Streptomyces sp. NBC_00525]
MNPQPTEDGEPPAGKLLWIPCRDETVPHLCRPVLDALGAGTEILAVPAPRDNDEPRNRAGEDVAALADRAASGLGGAPYAVYDCAPGGATGYALARALVAAGHRSPRHLFVSAGPAAECRCPDRAGAVAAEPLKPRDSYRPYGRPADPAPLTCPVTAIADPREPAACERCTDALWAGRGAAAPVTHLRAATADQGHGEPHVRRVAGRMRAALAGEPVLPAAAPVTREVFREAMSRVASPVSVVTALSPEDGRPRAFTASAMCSLSEEPQLLLVCVNRAGRAHDVFTTADRFLINVLTHEQAGVALAFARHDRARAEAELVPLEGGLPGLPDASARLLCTREDVLPGGDHSIVVGRLEAVTLLDETPLIHYRRNWHRPVAVPAPPPS